MEPKPKERIVFDEDPYYGGEGDEMAVEDLMSRDGLTEEEVRESYTDDEIFYHAMDLKNLDYEEEMGQLKDFFDGANVSDKEHNPNWGNHILVAGSTQTYFGGVRTGISPYKDFTAATDCSPNRYGLSNIFADCEIRKVWDENGTLHLSGSHHDGGVTVEMRQLTDEGEKLYSEWLDDDELYLPEDGFTVMGKTYRDGDESRFVHDLFENPEMCAAPRYLEQAFGCPALVYEFSLDGGRVDSLSATRNADGTFDVLRYSDGLAVGGGYHAESLSDAKAYCERFAKYQTECVDESGVSLSGESRDMISSRDGLAENQMGIEGKAAECREAATALADGDAL